MWRPISTANTSCSPAQSYGVIGLPPNTWKSLIELRFSLTSPNRCDRVTLSYGSDIRRVSHPREKEGKGMSQDTTGRIPIRDDLRPNTASIRAREALTSLEDSLRTAKDTIIARRFWEQVEELEGLAHRFQNDLTDPAYVPNWDLMS